MVRAMDSYISQVVKPRTSTWQTLWRHWRLSEAYGREVTSTEHWERISPLMMSRNSDLSILSSSLSSSKPSKIYWLCSKNMKSCARGEKNYDFKCSSLTPSLPGIFPAWELLVGQTTHALHTLAMSKYNHAGFTGLHDLFIQQTIAHSLASCVPSHTSSISKVGQQYLWRLTASGSLSDNSAMWVFRKAISTIVYLC